MRKTFKNKINKIIVSALAASMVIGMCGTSVYAAEQNSKKEYILCKANGEVKKYIITDEANNKLKYMDTDASYPLKTEVTYTLDKKEVTPSEIAGAKGDVAIDIKYDGSDDNYSAVTLMLLDETNFSDIKISSGKIISDGDKSVLVGITKIPGTLHIEAKATKFEIKAMYAMATDSLSSEIDIEDFAPVFGIDISGIKDTIKELKSVSSKDSDDDMSISEGINELTNGIGQLSDGLTTLDSNSDQLVDGAKQVFQSLIDMANDEIAKSGADIPKLTINNYSKVLSNVISSASPEGVTKTARSTVEGKVRDNEAVIRAAVEQAVKTEVTAQVTEKVKETVQQGVVAAMGFSEDDYKKALAAGIVNADTINNVVNGKINTPEIQAKIASEVQNQMTTSKVKNIINQKTNEQISSLVDKNMNSAEVQGQIALGIAKGSQGTPTLKALKTKLDSYNKFYQGLIQYTDGVSKAKEGASTINAATSEISGSTKSLLGDDTLSLINDADDLIEKAETKKDSVKYIIKFDSIK